MLDYLINMLLYQDKNKLTALHWAVMCEHHSHIRVLISDGHASVGIQDNDGRTPLNYAMLNYSSNCIKVTPMKTYNLT